MQPTKQKIISRTVFVFRRKPTARFYSKDTTEPTTTMVTTSLTGIGFPTQVQKI